ncbi:hypothetical protein, conserved [Eimeria praecox]|uniref:Uncharacterized protein n=1 Tax=Eimeria praecox TaxID=51316 RepID=U6G370_9EIME|nr:hypothetical protein, conserved [Eimeria praecox]
MAALLHLSRLRQALLSSARDAGEVLSKAFRADEASRVSQVVASFLDCPRTAPDGETAQPTASTANQGSSQVFIQSADIQTANYASERSKMATNTPSCEPPFEPSASASEGFAELRTTKNSSRTLDSRLEESEGWFLTDMISGCEEGSLHAQRIRNGTNSSGGSSVGSSSPSRDRGSMVMVSSVESLVSAEGDADDIDCLSSGGSSKDGEDNQSRIIAPISTSAGCSSVGEATKADAVAVAADLEQQTEQAIVPLLSELGRQYGDEAIYAISRKPAFGIKRFYMIEAGHGWSSYQSLEHLLRFLGETVKVFGAGHLRTTKFLLPVEEAEGFLDELQKIAPYSLKDFVSAAKAGIRSYEYGLISEQPQQQPEKLQPQQQEQPVYTVLVLRRWHSHLG